MASVKALYSYSYQYDGAEISFVQGDEFKLLSKASKEWWHVRRWREGVAQDIYVPANYVAEVEEAPVADENPTYENIEELLQKQRLAREKREKADKPAPKPQPAEKVPPDHDLSSDNTYAVVGPKRGSSDRELSSTEGHGPGPLQQDQARPNEYDRLVTIPDSSSSSKQGGVGGGGSSYVQTACAPPGADGYSEPSVVMTRKNSSKKEPQPNTAQPPPVALKPAATATEDKSNKPQGGGPKSIAEGWMPGYALPTTTATKTRSLTTAGSRGVEGGDGEGGTTSSLERFTRASTPERAVSVRRPVGVPTVRPKVQARPMSMHMESIPTAAMEADGGANVSAPKSSDALSSNMSSLKMALEQKLMANNSKAAGVGAVGVAGGVTGELGSGGGRQPPPLTVPKPSKVPLTVSAELANKLNKMVSVPPPTGASTDDGKTGSAGIKMEKTPSPDEKVGVAYGRGGTMVAFKLGHQSYSFFQLHLCMPCVWGVSVE